MFLAEDGIWLCCKNFTRLLPEKIVGVPVFHLAVNGGEVYYVQYKDES